MNPNSPIVVSVLIPAKDEAENLPELARLCGAALGPAGFGFEVIVIDDGSTDGTPKVLAELAAQYPWFHGASHRHQRGIADALRTGANLAKGEVLVFYPGDLQYLPEDIPRLVAPILAGEADIVTGTKQGKYEKRFVSGVYNLLCRWLFGVRVTDLNSVKAYRREIMEVQPLRPDWHRYMVVVAAAEGYRLTSTPVPLYPRRAGRSKFGWGRIPIGVLDLLSVWFQLRFGRKPMMFFGVLGAVLFFTGFLVGVFALVQRYVYGFGFRPLLDLIMVLVISGVSLFGFGFVGEMVAQQREEIRELQRRQRE